MSAISDVRSCVTMPRQAVDDLPRRPGIGLLAGLRRLPQRFGGLDRRAIDAAGRGDPDLILADVSRRRACRARCAGRPRAVSRSGSGVRDRAIRELADEAADLVARDAAREGDLLDLAVAQIAREADQRRRPARQPRAVDDHLVADEADDDRWRASAARSLRRAGERVDAALHQRMRAASSSSGAAHRRGEPPDELFGLSAAPSVSFAPAPPAAIPSAARRPSGPRASSAALALAVPRRAQRVRRPVP